MLSRKIDKLRFKQNRKAKKIIIINIHRRKSFSVPNVTVIFKKKTESKMRPKMRVFFSISWIVYYCEHSMKIITILEIYIRVFFPQKNKKKQNKKHHTNWNIQSLTESGKKRTTAINTVFIVVLRSKSNSANFWGTINLFLCLIYLWMH